MANPRFSVLIPTRDRPATFRHTLATVATQPGDDYEIVVADNCGGPATRMIVEEWASSRIRYTRSEEVLPMAENWERGLSLCSGDYVTVLGDDDGLLPSTFAMARRLVAAAQFPVLSWSPHTYWWPDTIVYWNANRLYLNFGNEARVIESRPTLEQFYSGAVSFGVVPMIYSAFFHRAVIDEARRRYGGFFVPKDTAPDISSGILGLYLTQQFVYSARPLSVRGNSGKSNGTAQWARSLGAKQREVYFREERIGLQGIIHKDLVPSPSLPIIVASAKLKCREAYFPQDPVLTVDLRGVVRELIANLNFEPEAYEENLADTKALAAKIGMELAPGAIPSMQPRQRVSTWGPTAGANNSITGLGVNCDLAGVHHIADAARLVDALLPSLAGYA